MDSLVTVRESEIVRRPRSLEELVEEFILSQDLGRSSKETYRRQLKQYARWIEESGRSENLWQMKREDLLDYKVQLLAGHSVLGANGYLTAVRRLYEWMEAERIYPNIARGVRGYKKPRSFAKDCLSTGQLRDMLDGLETASLEGLRDYAMINLMARTGLRDIEVSRAMVSDLRQESGQSVLWIQGKGRDSKDEFVLLTDEAERPIRQYLQARGMVAEDAPLFCSYSDKNYGQALTTRSISRICKQAMRRTGLDSSRLTAHSLRHTAITLSLRGGASLQQVQAMARHSDPKTTMIYSHNLDRIESGAERYISF